MNREDWMRRSAAVLATVCGVWTYNIVLAGGPAMAAVGLLVATIFLGLGALMGDVEI